MAAMVKLLPEEQRIKPARLHPKHRKFVEEYLKTGNAKQSAISAGYSPTCAASVGCNLLQLPKIVRAITSRHQKLDIKADDILQEVALIAFGRVSNYWSVGEDGQPTIDFSGTKPDQFAALAEYREDATGGDGDGERRRVLRRTIKMQPKMHALEALMDHLHLRDQRVELDVGDNLADRLQRARMRTLDATPDAAQAQMDAHSVAPRLAEHYDDSFDNAFSELVTNELTPTQASYDDSFDAAIGCEQSLPQLSTSLPPMGEGDGGVRYMENLQTEQVEDAGIISTEGLAGLAGLGMMSSEDDI